MDSIIQSAAHPDELVAIFQYLMQDNVAKFTKESELPEKSDPSYSYCASYFYLNRTSRSFARVIQSLNEELRHPVAVFYLVLRGLDTIEDDMTIEADQKIELLRSFYRLTVQDGWNFQGNGPNEKDAILLREYEVVIKELKSINPKYQKTIVEIARRMGNGMADFITKKVETIGDFNLYTHYVAGLVGIGLTQLFVDSGLEERLAGEDLDTLSNEMGQFLQKVNILKDFLTDIEEGRLFWPKEVWSLYVVDGAGPEELAKIENKNSALACLNHLCADALTLAPSCLEYLSRLQEPSIFSFAAIPQVMALATFDLFYNNYDLFTKRGTKIRKGLAVKLIMEATNIHKVKDIYRKYVLSISAKSRKLLGSNPEDQSFEALSVACANTMRWIKDHDQLVNQKESALVKSNYLFHIIVIVLVLLLFGQIPGVN